MRHSTSDALESGGAEGEPGAGLVAAAVAGEEICGGAGDGGSFGFFSGERNDLNIASFKVAERLDFEIG